MTEELALKGIEIRKKRAEEKWLRMWQAHTDPITPMSVTEIAVRFKKKNGKRYSDKYIYQAFKKLKVRGLI